MIPTTEDHNQHLQERLQEMFADQLNLYVPTAETDLLVSGLLDSLALVELLLHLEHEFGILISPDELEPNHFRSLNSIAEFIVRQRSLVQV
jgi:acyl carrier protein